MPEQTSDPSREERLAAQLRANLRRRKEQARARSAEPNGRSGDAGSRDPSQTG